MLNRSAVVLVPYVYRSELYRYRCRNSDLFQADRHPLHARSGASALIQYLLKRGWCVSAAEDSYILHPVVGVDTSCRSFDPAHHILEAINGAYTLLRSAIILTHFNLCAQGIHDDVKNHVLPLVSYLEAAVHGCL